MRLCFLRRAADGAPVAAGDELDNIGDYGLVCAMFPGTPNSSPERSSSVEVSFHGGDDDASALGGGPLHVEFFRQVGVLLGS